MDTQCHRSKLHTIVQFLRGTTQLSLSSDLLFVRNLDGSTFPFISGNLSLIFSPVAGREIFFHAVLPPFRNSQKLHYETYHIISLFYLLSNDPSIFQDDKTFFLITVRPAFKNPIFTPQLKTVLTWYFFKF